MVNCRLNTDDEQEAKPRNACSGSRSGRQTDLEAAPPGPLLSDNSPCISPWAGPSAEIISKDTTTNISANRAPPAAGRKSLKRFPQSTADALGTLKKLNDSGLMAMWTLTKDGRCLISAPRIGIIRSILRTTYHYHRGQLSVYLRLLEVPVPSTYGLARTKPVRETNGDFDSGQPLLSSSEILLVQKADSRVWLSQQNLDHSQTLREVRAMNVTIQGMKTGKLANQLLEVNSLKDQTERVVKRMQAIAD